MPPAGFRSFSLCVSWCVRAYVCDGDAGREAGVCAQAEGQREDAQGTLKQGNSVTLKVRARPLRPLAIQGRVLEFIEHSNMFIDGSHLNGMHELRQASYLLLVCFEVVAVSCAGLSHCGEQGA